MADEAYCCDTCRRKVVGPRPELADATHWFWRCVCGRRNYVVGPVRVEVARGRRGAVGIAVAVRT